MAVWEASVSQAARNPSGAAVVKPLEGDEGAQGKLRVKQELTPRTADPPQPRS